MRVIEAHGLSQVREAEQLRVWIDGVLSKHAAEVRRYRVGERNLFGYFMGEVMRASSGRADPLEARRLLKASLDGG